MPSTRAAVLPFVLCLIFLASACLAAEVHLTDLGAAADGKADAAVSLQRAIDAAGPGDVVSIPAGTFVVGEPVRLRSGVRVCGTGPSTVLRFAGRGPAALLGVDVRDIRVSDLTIEGTGSDEDLEDNGAISLKLTTGEGEVAVGLSVERVSVRGLHGSGITVHGNGTVWATGVTIRDCAFDDLGNHGTLGYFARHYLVDHCSFRNMGRSGTIFARCKDVTVRDCFVRTTGWHGIEVGDETEGFLIEANSIEDSGDHAGVVAEQAAHRGTIAHNRISAPRFRGIQLNNKPAVAAVCEVFVTDNLIDMAGNTSQPGILVYGDTTYTVDDCHIAGNVILGGQTGIEAHYLRRCRIERNTVREPQQGLKFVFLNQVAIAHNLLTGCVTGGIGVAPYVEVFTNSEVTVAGNTIHAAVSEPAPDTGISLSALRGGLVAGNWIRGFARELTTTGCSDVVAERSSLSDSR